MNIPWHAYLEKPCNRIGGFNNQGIRVLPSEKRLIKTLGAGSDRDNFKEELLNALNKLKESGLTELYQYCKKHTSEETWKKIVDCPNLPTEEQKDQAWDILTKFQGLIARPKVVIERSLTEARFFKQMTQDFQNLGLEDRVANHIAHKYSYSAEGARTLNILQTLVPGETLWDYFARRKTSQEDIKKFYNSQIVEDVFELYEKTKNPKSFQRYVLLDLNPTNVMKHPTENKWSYIDFEPFWRFDKTNPLSDSNYINLPRKTWALPHNSKEFLNANAEDKYLWLSSDLRKVVEKYKESPDTASFDTPLRELEGKSFNQALDDYVKYLISVECDHVLRENYHINT